MSQESRGKPTRGKRAGPTRRPRGNRRPRVVPGTDQPMADPRFNSNGDWGWNCTFGECPQFSNREDTILRHYRNVHLSERREDNHIECQSCDKVSQTHKQAEAHVAIHDPKNGSDQCDLCEVAWFEQAGSLTMHENKSCPERENRPPGSRKWNNSTKKFELVEHPTAPAANQSTPRSESISGFSTTHARTPVASQPDLLPDQLETYFPHRQPSSEPVPNPSQYDPHHQFEPLSPNLSHYFSAFPVDQQLPIIDHPITSPNPNIDPRHVPNDNDNFTNHHRRGGPRSTQGSARWNPLTRDQQGRRSGHSPTHGHAVDRSESRLRSERQISPPLDNPDPALHDSHSLEKVRLTERQAIRYGQGFAM